jgi:putative addiction module component (TIGR02574 family)
MSESDSRGSRDRAPRWALPQARCERLTTLPDRLDWVMATAEMLAKILRLPAEERARLALELIRSLDGEPEVGADEAWAEEIDRRGAEVEAGTAETITLEEYRAHVRRRRVARASR